MQVSRTAVSSALFTLLQNAYPWVTSDPRLQVPDNLSADAQPALFLVKPDEGWDQDQRMSLTRYTLKYFVLVLVKASSTPEDSGNTCENVMDNILDAIDRAMQPPPGPGFKQTLGGLVTNAWIEGHVQIDTPILFPQGAIWIPITVLVGA